MFGVSACSGEMYLLAGVLLGVCLGSGVTQMGDDFLEYGFFEESLPGTCVISLMPNIELRHRYGVSDIRSFRFSFLTQPNLDRQYFVIDETSGEIQNAFKVDREVICPRMDDCVLKFDVVIQPIKYFQIIKVKVEIKDINDNAPAFPEKVISHQISELAETGTAFVVPAATDPDSRNLGIHGYDLFPRNGKFELSQRVTADGGTDLRLILRERLDREIQEFHLVTVLAIDGGTPPKTGSISVNITVQDANDNNPHFENTTYEVFVPESTAVDTVIVKVKATDRDSGLNAAIVYEFSKHTKQEYGHLFGIKSESGKIYLRNSLDYETGAIYLLSVTANDRGPDNLPAHASVVIRVEDVNDHTPHISVNTLTTNTHAEVRENSEIGTFVAHLSVVDEDSGDNGRFLCSVDDQNFVLEPIYASELKLVTVTRLDREQRDLYDLSISCKDYGRSPQTSVVPLKVKVTDENDHTPRFQRDFYETTIAENNDVGVTLFSVMATDHDDGQNGEVVYKTETRLERYIRLDSHTGIVTSAVSFDYEELKELEFHLTASDLGTPPRASSARMRLVVMDTDDQRPKFTTDRFLFTVVENQAKWSEVGTVVAHDNDSAPFNSFTYRLDSSKPEVMELFELNPISGRLTARESLDRERKSVYHMTVYAAVTSGDHVTYTASAGVTVRVDDVNDNSPMFTRPSTGNETISVSAMTPRGHSIARLHAVDFDTGRNANLTYQLISSTRPDLFRVIAATGDVIVADHLSRITMETVLLRLAVRDNGQPSLSDEAQLRVVVNSNIPFAIDSLPLSILASEDMVVVLSFTLAIILLAIAIIVAIICVFRRRSRRTGRRYDGVGEHTGNGSGFKSSEKSVFDCSMAPTNGKLQDVEVKGHGRVDLLGLTSSGNAHVSNAFVMQESLDHCNSLLESIYADSVLAKSAYSDLRQISEPKKPVVVFIRDQSEIDEDCSKDRLHGDEHGVFLEDRKRGCSADPSSYHTLPLPPTHHRQHQSFGGPDRLARGGGVDWSHQRLPGLYPRLRSVALSTSNIEEILGSDSPEEFVGAEAVGGGGGCPGDSFVLWNPVGSGKNGRFGSDHQLTNGTNFRVRFKAKDTRRDFSSFCGNNNNNNSNSNNGCNDNALENASSPAVDRMQPMTGACAVDSR